jgi:transposase InsO family protein
LYYNSSEGQKLVLPKHCRWQILRVYHDDGGHLALDKTLRALKSHFWFPKMRRFVQKYIDSCITYHKLKAGKQPGYLHPFNKIAIPFHTVHVDHLGPFPKSSEGWSYLFLLIGAFTKFIFIRPVRSTKSTHVIRELQEIISIFGVPNRLICDAATSFTSKKFTQFCSTTGIHQFINTVGVPRGNGQIERYCRTIQESLATTTASSTVQWPSHLKTIQLELNNTLNKSLNATPQELLMGYRAVTASTLPITDQLSSTTPLDFSQLRADASKRIAQRQKLDKKRFDSKGARHKPYTIGDLVVVRIASIVTKGESKKLLAKWQGSFKVTK